MENILSKQFQRQYDMMLDWTNGQINSLSDEEFKIELSPGKNHGVWLFGHLIASEDDFSLFMDKGELMFPEFSDMFGQKSKLMPVENYPSVPELKKYWKHVTEKNQKIYSALTDNELTEPHAMLKDYDTDYFKTKERVIMAWQLHQLYHTGQLGLIVSKTGKNKY